MKPEALGKQSSPEKGTPGGGVGVTRSRATRWIVTTIGAGMSLFAILYLSTALDYLNININLWHYRITIFGCLMLLSFLAYRATRTSRQALPWYDVVLAFLSVITVAYFFLFPADVEKSQVFALVKPHQLVLALICTLLLLEAIRRLAGWGMAIVVLFFLVYPLTSSFFPGFLQGVSLSLARVEWMVYLSPEGIFGLPLDVAAVIIIAYIIFGQFLYATGAGTFFLNVGFSLLGQFRGGPAKGAVIASALFGTISGSTAANVATTGVFTIPLMKSIGYRPDFAGAVETVASNGGQIMPPVLGAVAFIMAQFLGVPYWTVCLAAVLPAILYFVAVLVAVDLEANKLSLKGLPRAQLPSLKKTLKNGWYYLLPPMVLVYFLGVIQYTPQKSALLALVLVVLLSFVRRETWLTPRKLLAALEDSGKQMVVVGITCAGAGIIIGSLGLTAMGLRLGHLLVDLSGGLTFPLLLLTAAASFVLGMAGSGIACYVMLAVAVAPALVKTGILPLAAHMFLLYWGIVAYISPPVAIGAYVASGISGGSPWNTGWIACRLGIATFIVPFFFVYNPALLMIGSPQQIVLAAVASLVGITALACGAAGYLVRKENWGQRIALSAGAIAIMSPGWQVSLMGLALIAMAVLWHLRVWRVSRRIPLKTPDS